MPDLVVIDGGPGQVTAAKHALQTLGLQIPLIGLAKEHEEIYLPDESSPRNFDKNSRMMLLLRKIRDAAHDFSLGYNRKRRQMRSEKNSNKRGLNVLFECFFKLVKSLNYRVRMEHYPWAKALHF